MYDLSYKDTDFVNPQVVFAIVFFDSGNRMLSIASFQKMYCEYTDLQAILEKNALSL